MNQSNRNRTWQTVLAAVVSLAIGVAAGVKWHGEIAHFLGMHGGGTAAPATKPAKQLWTCGMHPQVIQDKPGNCPICGMALEPLATDAAGGGAHSMNAITIDPVVVQNMGVRTTRIGEGPIRRTVRAVGYLEQAQPRIHDINLRISGWVEKLYADTEGMLVQKGQPLFDLYSPEVQVAVEELITARRAVEGLAADADEAARRTAEVLVGAARRKLEQWGLALSQIEELARLDRAPRTVAFLSPVTAEVSEKMVVQGAMVKMGERALRLVDRSLLWLDAQVYAQDLPFIQLGQKVAATIEAMPGQQFQGTVLFIHPQVDPVTRTARVRMALNNSGLSLRPGMFATATITAQLLDNALLVPREAILDTGTRQVVFVSLEQGHFEPRKIATGPADDDGNVQVLSGLAAGEMVVTSGQFLMDAESRMKEAIQKHLSMQHAGPTGAPGPATPAATAPASPRWIAAVDATVTAYLRLHAALTADPQPKEPLDMAAITEAAGALKHAAGDDTQTKAADSLLAAAKAMAGHPLAHQREMFKKVSDAAVDLAGRWTPTKAAAPRLFVMTCSMVKGQWLQAGDEVANPYDPGMRRCATGQRELPVR